MDGRVLRPVFFRLLGQIATPVAGHRRDLLTGIHDDLAQVVGQRFQPCGAEELAAGDLAHAGQRDVLGDRPELGRMHHDDRRPDAVDGFALHTRKHFRIGHRDTGGSHGLDHFALQRGRQDADLAALQVVECLERLDRRD